MAFVFIYWIGGSMQTTATKNNRPANAPQNARSSFMAYYFYLGGVTVSIACAAALISACAQAQPAEPTAPKQAAASAAMPAAPEAIPADTAPATPATSAPASQPQAAAKPAPKYSAKDIERAFSFMDANKDGKISRAEAAGFRNVAKHFDAADSNKENLLSLEEFGNALNRP